MQGKAKFHHSLNVVVVTSLLGWQKLANLLSSLTLQHNAVSRCQESSPTFSGLCDACCNHSCTMKGGCIESLQCAAARRHMGKLMLTYKIFVEAGTF